MKSFYILALLFTALTAGFWSYIFKRWSNLSKITGFLSLGVSGLIAIYSGIDALITKDHPIFSIASGFMEVTWFFRLDALSGFFLTIIGIIVVSISIYGPSYLRQYESKRSAGDMIFFTGLTIAGMYLVLLSHDLLSFIFAWELMSISSYFLVAYQHEESANRSAALIYLLMAHASGLFILLAFGVLANFSQDFSFISMQNAHLNPKVATLVALLALTGFSIKAGLMPFHVWLPRAYKAAPSHISALMSGVMMKVAVYGLLRFIFGLLKEMAWQWGVLILVLGTISAVLGVLYALMQHDLKKLLAYSSVENLGIIYIGVGFSILFFSLGFPLLGTLGLIAALYHSLNHALFKSLLFLSAGVVLQNSKEHDLEKMGGLVRKMPYTALFFLIGCISISALPPFNGFVSEWLTFQAALQSTILKGAMLRALIPITAALLALAGALAAACFVKVYGVAFLGRSRNTESTHQIKDADLSMRVAMTFLALLCLLFGIFPSSTINFINHVPQDLFGFGLIGKQNWFWLIPVSNKTISYNGLFIFIATIAIGLIVYWLLNVHYGKSRYEIGNAWSCGFGNINSKMQYTGAAFSMPIRRVFQKLWLITEKIDEVNGEKRYSLHVDDRILKYFYEPIEPFILRIGKYVAYIQGGKVRVYLAYMFVTLVILLSILFAF